MADSDDLLTVNVKWNGWNPWRVPATPSDCYIPTWRRVNYFGLTRLRVEKQRDGILSAEFAPFWPFLYYILIRVNFYAKMVYILCIVFKIRPTELAFEEYQGDLVDNLLVLFEMLIIDYFFLRKDPFFNLLKEGLQVTDHINANVSSDKGYRLRKRLMQSVVECVGLHAFVVAMCLPCYSIQFYADPKFLMNTYSLLKVETPLLTAIFCIHETWSGDLDWPNYAGFIAARNLLGWHLQHSLVTLTEAAEDLHVHPDLDQDSLETPPRFSEDNRSLMSSYSNKSIYFFDGDNHINTPSEKDKYSIETLVMDYKKLALYAKLLNQFGANLYLALDVVTYIQIILDVFVIFQTLRDPNGDMGSVAYFMMDASLNLIVYFYCFRAMSFVSSASESFKDALKHLLCRLPNDKREYWGRVLESLPTVAMNLGPDACDAGTVGNALMILVNYFVCAAMWPDTKPQITTPEEVSSTNFNFTEILPILPYILGYSSGNVPTTA